MHARLAQRHQDSAMRPVQSSWTIILLVVVIAEANAAVSQLQSQDITKKLRMKMNFGDKTKATIAQYSSKELLKLDTFLKC